MVLLSKKTLWPHGEHISEICFYQVTSLPFVMKQGRTFVSISIFLTHLFASMQSPHTLCALLFTDLLPLEEASVIC